MLDMLFLLSRLESTADLELAPVNLNLVVAGVCQSIASARGDKPQLIVELQPHLPPVMAHSEYLQAALMQILDNAYNFTLPEGVIRVQVTSSEQQVCIEISDTGCGIHPDSLPYIFDVFWQHSSADSLPGLGVGLSIARRVVQLHHGQIEAHSEVGRGTTMRLILPTADSSISAP